MKIIHGYFFSAKYGTGKTYFLNQFFQDSEDYEVFHLYPVDYQIASNENIIDFLKADILVELQKKHNGIIEPNDYSNFLDLQRLLYVWSKDHVVDISKFIGSHVSRLALLGKPFKDVVDLTESFLSFKKQIESGDKGRVENFLKDLKNKKISEADPMSDLLKSKIELVKENKKSVLVLDDLDRIDPQHVFRMLNCFSAHFDSSNNELPNKFGFDVIVLVGDFANLKSIFHHMYGSETDFNGYFNKFFSREIFQFNNNQIIFDSLSQVISAFPHHSTYNDGFIKKWIYFYFSRTFIKKWLRFKYY